MRAYGKRGEKRRKNRRNHPFLPRFFSRGLFRRGVSPLIATVLLIAFAVALGAVVMNWGKSYVEDQAEHAGSKSTNEIKCEIDIDLGVKEIRGEPKICYNNGSNASVVVMLENRGSEEIAGVRMTLIGDNEEVWSTDLNDSEIPAGGIKRFVQNYSWSSIGDIDVVEFTPKIQGEGSVLPVLCSKNSLVVDEIYVCGTT